MKLNELLRSIRFKNYYLESSENNIKSILYGFVLEKSEFRESNNPNETSWNGLYMYPSRLTEVKDRLSDRVKANLEKLENIGDINYCCLQHDKIFVYTGKDITVWSSQLHKMGFLSDSNSKISKFFLINCELGAWFQETDDKYVSITNENIFFPKDTQKQISLIKSDFNLWDSFRDLWNDNTKKYLSHLELGRKFGVFDD